METDAESQSNSGGAPWDATTGWQSNPSIRARATDPSGMVTEQSGIEKG